MWHTQAAAVTGSGHQRKGLPCQDRTWSLSENNVTAIALADGAGSAPLSHEGAEIAVHTACQVLCRRFEELYAAATPMEMRQAVLREVRENLRKHAAERNAAVGDLACTLLAVAVCGDRYLVFHVGDGVIGYRKNGKLLVASAPRNGEFSNTTIFVTSPDALRQARVLRGVQPQTEGFILMSDGCEAALYRKNRPGLAPLASRLLERAELLEQESSFALLVGMLEAVISRRRQDDCSLALMTRSTGTLAGWEHMTQREQAAVLGVITGNRNRRRRAIRKYAGKYGAGRHV